MKNILLISLIAIIQVGCAITRAESQMMLEKRADIDGSHAAINQMSNIDTGLLEPVRTKPQIADIWVHPHELPNGDYFRGAWIRTIVRKSSWGYKANQSLLMKETKKKARSIDEED